MAGESDEDNGLQFPQEEESGDSWTKNTESLAGAGKAPAAASSDSDLDEVEPTIDRQSQAQPEKDHPAGISGDDQLPDASGTPAAGDSSPAVSGTVDFEEARSKASVSYVICRFIVVRGIALVYLIAFFSLFTQIDGLLGANGILPIARLMQAVAGGYTPFDFPTVFWVASTDSFIKGTCIAGMAFSALAAAGIFSGPALLICWVLYLSFLTTGQDFMSFQWDILLLESGIIAAFLAPWAMASPPVLNIAGSDGPPSRIAIWLLRWLLFRLMFMSGLCKLISGDEAWWNLTALTYHYETQPLPTPLAWVCNLFPLWFQELSCLLMFGIEIFIPFLIFGNKLMKRIAFGALAGLQILILLSGNYTFFNLLSIILCFTLIDDSVWRLITPSFLKAALENSAVKTGSMWQKTQSAIVLPMVAMLCLANACMLSLRANGPGGLPGSMMQFVSCIQQYHLVNGYGLFAVMTQKRIEIVLEGSNDGKEWSTYEFRYKPGDLKRPPPIIAPLQPRLDWQMWFAALGRFEDNQWFAFFVRGILHGDKEVTALLAKNPFPDRPPKYLRAHSYQYHFTDAKELFSTGKWWKRTFAGEYMPVAKLE